MQPVCAHMCYDVRNDVFPDDMSVHEGEREERPMSAQSQMSVYKHQPSIYDTSITFKTELRTQDQIEGTQPAAHCDVIVQVSECLWL